MWSLYTSRDSNENLGLYDLLVLYNNPSGPLIMLYILNSGDTLLLFKFAPGPDFPDLLLSDAQRKWVLNRF